MARLSVPPSKRVSITQETTPPPPSDISDDAEAATQQLLDEVRASASKAKTSNPLPSSDPPPFSAVLGANLLNAARIEYRHSSPLRMGPKPSNGRLSRVGQLTEPRRQNLVRPRQRDVYEFPDESPEKMPFKLPEKVNRSQPMKIVKKKKAHKEDVVPPSDPVQPSSEGNGVGEPSPEDSEASANEPPMPSSPPRVAQGSNNVDENGVQIETTLSDGNARCTVTSYRSNKPAGPRYEQCHNVATHDTDNGPQCSRHVSKPGSVRCEYMVVQDGDLIQCRTAGVRGTSRCSKHVGKPMNNEAAQKRKSVDEVEMPDGSTRSTKLRRTESNAEVQVPVRESRKGRPASQKPGSKQSQPSHEEEVADSIEDVESTSPNNARRTSSEAQNTQEESSRSRQGKTGKSSKSTTSVPALPKAKKCGDRAAREDQPQSANEGEEDDDQGQEGSVDEKAISNATHMPRAVRRAFRYLKLEKRPGRCKTELCLSIESVCEKVCHLLQGSDLSVEEIAENIDDVQGVLNEVRNTEKEHRASIKADMYGYIFRSLTKVLRSLYHGLEEYEDNFTNSLDAMRIFSPLVHHILIIKDLMASWKVTVPQHYEGDRIIKDVDSHLIAPLRIVHDEFSKRLRQLEGKERAKQELADSERRIEEENEETERTDTTQAAQKDRWTRWQSLHIARMACEPDPRKRVPLRIVKLEDLEEMDANGVKFQRLPVFKDRSTLPIRHPQAVAKLKSWSDEQQEVLIEGLQDFSGPDVYEKIFNAYCRPRNGGLLREFRVVDIVTKAAWIRTNVTKLHQEKGWEMPDWVRQIPMLP